MMAAGLLCLMTASAQMVDSIGWRSVFTEPQLAGLIETALERNADLRTANLNVVQAEAQLKAARLAFLPSLTVGAEGQLQKTKGQATQKTYNKLSAHGIAVIRGCQGKVDDILKAYLNGELKDSLESCDHHDCDHHQEKPLYFVPSFGK